MKISLDHKKDHLCVLFETEVQDRPHAASNLKAWYPVYPADRAEVASLLGRPLNRTDPEAGLFVDEEGNSYQLAEKARTAPLEIETEPVELEQSVAANGRAAGKLNSKPASVAKRSGRRAARRSPRTERVARELRSKLAFSASQLDAALQDQESAPEPSAPATPAPLSLRQKLALVRRRITYVQKRGRNELHDYSYVTAADIAGAVGDLFAELGVVVVPKLESISHEPLRAGVERVARVIMNYSFVDVESGEEITARVAGEGLDAGDKAPYKAMTGALKYALLQSFLLATGDDPEEERLGAGVPAGADVGLEQPISPEQLVIMQELIEETGTDLERVLAYYKLNSLRDMNGRTFHRALELLNRKKAKRGAGDQADAAH